MYGISVLELPGLTPQAFDGHLQIPLIFVETFHEYMNVKQP
jgi:hypothetical protein